MKKWIAVIISVATLIGCGGQNSPTSQKVATPKPEAKSVIYRSIGFTPESLLSDLSGALGIHLIKTETGRDDEGNETVTYNYEYGAAFKGALNPDRTYRYLVAFFIRDGNKDNGWRRKQLLEGLVWATNRKMSYDNVSRVTEKLLRKAANNKGKMQKTDIGNIRCGITAIPPKTVFLMLIPAGEEWPSEVKQKKS